MHKLAKTCQILYDIDILSKKEEINKLKENLNLILSIPKIEYSDKEWNEAEENFYKNINQFIVGNDSKENNQLLRPLIDLGAKNDTSYLKICEKFLENELKKLTKNTQLLWCKYKASDCIKSILISITGLDHIKEQKCIGTWPFINWGYNITKLFIEGIIIKYFEEIIRFLPEGKSSKLLID